MNLWILVVCATYGRCVLCRWRHHQRKCYFFARNCHKERTLFELCRITLNWRTTGVVKLRQCLHWWSSCHVQTNSIGGHSYCTEGCTAHYNTIADSLWRRGWMMTWKKGHLVGNDGAKLLSSDERRVRLAHLADIGTRTAQLQLERTWLCRSRKKQLNWDTIVN